MFKYNSKHSHTHFSQTLSSETPEKANTVLVNISTTQTNNCQSYNTINTENRDPCSVLTAQRILSHQYAASKETCCSLQISRDAID